MDNNDDKYKVILKKAANKIEELTKKINEKNNNDEIVVIGYSCHFPGGANTPEKFWELLANGVDPVTEIKESRFDYNEYYSEDMEEKGKTITKNAAFLEEDIKEFDNVHFGISAIEAKSIDPQHRLLLEISWEAMENSNLNIEKLKGSRTGVFVAINTLEYQKKEFISGDVNDITPYSMIGTLNNSASGRLSYFYDFKGPAITFDTACSSSIVALNAAMDSLKNNQCDMAIVGGVNLILEPESFIGLTKFGGLSKDGRCKAFDNSADGFGRGEGCGVIILKRLKDARADGNEISALVKEVDIGQDGKANGFTAPNGISQQNLIKQTLDHANLNVNDVDYIETHGTGTSLGDHIEAQSISEVFKNKKNKMLIGSVKSNIGHLEGAAGMASIIKVLLAIEKKQLPPSIHFKEPNHNINWNKIQVVDKLIDWRKENGVRRAGISSFGFSGTLAHAIIEEVPSECENEELDILPYQIMTLSAKNEKALKAYIATIKEYILHEEKSIGDITYTTNISRSFLKYKYAITGKSKEEFIKKLDESLDETNNENYIYKKSNVNNKIAFLFTGQGSIYKDIAKDFYNTSMVFRETLNLCNEKFKEILDISLLDGIYSDEDKLIYSPIYSQPIIFSIEYALTKLWDTLGVKPNVVIGHSIGEYVAACYAGLISLDDAIEMIAERGKLMDSVDIDGKMVGILTNVENVRNAIEESGCKNVSIAAINAPENVTISGLSSEVDDVIKTLQSKQKVFINKLNIDQPYHSALMKNYTEKYNESIGNIAFSKLKVKMISGISGKLETEEFLGQRKYWVDHLCNTVNYQAAIENAKKLGVNIFIEIGGDATLTGLANQCIKDEEIKFLPSLRSGLENYTQFFNSISILYLSDIEINWELFYKTYNKTKVKLPNYSFQRKKFWIDSKNEDIKIKEYEEGALMLKKFQVNSDNGTDINKNILKDKAKIELELKEMIKSLTWLEIDEIEEDINLFTLGLDSLVLVSFNKKISGKYNVEISLNKFFIELDTIEKITEYIYENISEDIDEETYENIDEDILEDSVEYNNDNLLNLEQKTISSSNMNETRKIKLNSSLGDISAIEQIFNNQMKIMSEQLEIINKVTNTNSEQKINNKKALTINKEKTVNKDVKVNKKKGDFYVPYKKLDLTEKNAIDDLTLKYLKNIEEKYTSYTKNSKEYTQKYRKVYANNRNVAGFRPVLKEMVYQIVAKKGKGSKLYDLDDNELIDLTMGFGVNLFGHSPSFVQEALNQELLNGMPLGPMGKLAGQVAEQISELTGVERVAFYNSGTEADMVAVRIARAITGRKKIVTFAGSYHGTFDGFLGLPVESEDGEIVSISLAPGIMENMVKDLVILNYNSSDSLEYIKNNCDDIAGVLVESVQSRRPDVQPKEFLKKLRKVTEDNNIALIFDEIITGFRIAAGGAQEFFGIEADIVTYGKIAGGGMPIGIVAGKSKYLDSIDGGMWSYGDNSVPPCEEERTFVAGTFCHHPLAMAASNAMLKYIKQNKDTIYKNLNEKTNKFVNKINLYLEDEHVPISVVNFGSLFRFVLRGDFEIFYYGLIEKGIYVWEGRNCFLSTEHSDEEIEKLILAIKSTIQEMKMFGYFGGKEDDTIVNPEVALDKESNFEMSLIQKGIYTQSVRSEVDPYNLIAVFRIEGKLDIEKIESIIKEIIQRHESLRTRLYFEDEVLKQEVLDEINFSVNKIKKCEEDDLDNLISKSITNFNLAEAPLFKVTSINVGNNDNILIFNFHHAISDGISMDIVTHEFIKLYSNEILPPVKKQYRDFVNWEKEYLNSDERKVNEKYWLNKLAGYDYRLNLPTDYNFKSEESFISNTVKMIIDNNTVSDLKILARDNECSLYMILVTAFNVLLKKLSGNDDILIATPVTNRGVGLFEESIGMFTNTIVLRNNISDEKNLKVLIGEMKQNCLEAYSNMYYPFNLLLNNSGNKLSNVMFVYENANQRLFKLEDLEISTYDYDINSSDFDFSFEILEEEGGFNINLTYKTSLYKEETVKRWGEYYKNILNFILNNKTEDIKIKDLEILGEYEKYKLLVEFNDTVAEYPINKTIHELFEEQVEKTPDNIAVVYDDKKLTYKELNSKANQVASLLREKGVGPEKIVGIMVQRSIDMMVGIIGILKSGGAYLPIDPKYPRERIEYILEDSKADILLTQTKLVCKVDFNGTIIEIDSGDSYKQHNNNLEKVSEPSNLAYIIYTSGTTGNPKGVMVEHRNVVSYVNSFLMEYKLTSSDVVLQQASLCFDASVEEIYPVLLVGGKLVIEDSYKLLSKEYLIKFLDKNSITVVSCSTHIFNEILELNYSGKLSTLISGGDTLKLDTSAYVNKKYKLYNTYGPTEATVCATYYRIIGEKNQNIPIGKPISNARIYILDKNKKLQPMGIPGELCISGNGLARGYLNRQDLTDEKFVENPYEVGNKMYKTGDLARWLPDGNIEFLGRIDHQVKIRGFRIELGEIESNLLKLDGIKDAVVIGKGEEENKYLCVYYVSEIEYSVGELRERLKKSLPDYMIPSYFIKLKEIPITINGKVDKKLLPEPEGDLNIGVEYEAPRNEIEEKLVEIWQVILDAKKIGINDNFFELGGHSLKGIVLVNRISKALNVEIPLKVIFDIGNIRGIAEYINRSDKKKYEEIERVEEKEYYEASSTQKGMYILQEVSKESIAYNIPGAFEIIGKLDILRLKEAFTKLIKRHETLRTSFYSIGDNIVQKINDYEELNFEIEEIKISSEEEVEAKIKDFIKPFNLETWPLLRVGIICLDEDRNIMLVDMHHIISDGISMAILAKEFSKLYDGKDLSELSIQYKDYSNWQLKKRESEEFKKQEEYWLKEFSDSIPILNMPTDYERPKVKDFSGNNISFILDKELTKGLREIAKQTGSTMYMVLLTNINILLLKYSGQEDIVIGSPIADRNHRELENIIGMFVNTLPMRNNINSELSYIDNLNLLKEKVLKVYANQDYQFEELVEKLDVYRDLSRNPLFDIMFSHQNMEESKIEVEDFIFKSYYLNENTEKMDITIISEEVQEEINFNISYSTKLYKHETIERMIKHFCKIARETVKNIDIKIKDIEILEEDEKHKLLVEFNDIEADYIKDKTIVDLFEEQVEKTPNNIAVVFEDKKLTYKELNERSNLLARTLRENGVGPDDLAVIMVERSIEMIVGIIAILKAGGAYLPIDPEYPEDRIDYILKNSEVNMVLTQSKFEEKIKCKKNIYDLNDEELYKGSNKNLNKLTNTSNLLYVIYTSGTTGNPKGVMIEHRNLVSLMFNDKMQFDFNEKDVWTMFHSYCFDFSVWEMYGALLYGGKLIVVPRLVAQDTREFLRLIEKEAVTILNQTPTSFYRLSEEALKESYNNLILRYVIFGGEALKPSMLLAWKRKYGEIKLINMYGITETTVHVTFKEITDIEIQASISNVGVPIPTLNVYIMDKNMKLLPIGIPGELCVGGDGVGRGYLNNKELTEEKFIKNPYKPQERLYRSGDLARWLSDGNIEYLGRIDHQVKIRGFRIELGEIENNLLKIEGIKESVVFDKEEEGNKYLCAYYVSDIEYSVGELRKELKKYLPDYMIPSYFIMLEKIPLTSNGKIDRKVLANPEGKINTGVEYEAPRNEIEEKLVELWQGVLEVSNIGINENFFELGGHSLKATILVNRIHKELNVEIPLKVIFDKGNISGIAEYINRSDKKKYEKIERVEEKEYYETSSAQKRMYVLQEVSKDSVAYNIPSAFEIRGKLDILRVKEALSKLIKRHETLRTSFYSIGDKIVQKINNYEELHFEIGEIKISREEEVEAQIKDFIKPFNMETWPLLRAGIISLEEDRHIMLYDMHHIISDGTSMAILAKEFCKLYDGKDLNKLCIQYKDYSNWQLKKRESEEFKKQEEYWLKEFSDSIPKVNIPTDYERPKIKDFSGNNISLVLDKELTKGLREIAKQTGSTMYMVLLANINILLSKYSGQDDIVIGSPIAGRNHRDLENIIGMFVNTLAIRSTVNSKLAFNDYLKSVKEKVLKSYENQDYQFDDLVEKVYTQRELNINPLFDIMFAFQNMEDALLELEGSTLKLYDLNDNIEKMDITIISKEVNDNIIIDFNYAVSLFKKETIEVVKQHFIEIIEYVVKNPTIKIEEISISETFNKVKKIQYDKEFNF